MTSPDNSITKDNNKLWYRTPAASWIEALPVGNGRLGAMVYGGIKNEKIRLNEDTLWSGEPKDCNNHEAINWLSKARAAVFEGRHREAIEHCKKMQGAYNQSYQPFGSLHLEFDFEQDAKDYYRELDLSRAVVLTTFRVGETVFRREVFSSHPDQVIIVRLHTSKPGSLNFEAKLSSPHPNTISQENQRSIALRGLLPSHVDPNYYDSGNSPVSYFENSGMRFTGILHAKTVGGETTATNEGVISVKNADSATLIFSADSSFNGFDKSPSRQGVDPDIEALAHLHTATLRSDNQLIEDHIKDHQSLFYRSRLTLSPSRSDVETPKRIHSYTTKNDPGLVALLYDFGRYLLIASSREGTQPAHLQGIWSMDIRPPWSDNWTLNINSTMNYWPAQSTNLSECHRPILDFIKDLSITGKETAKIHYGAKGWVAHHNTDIWKQTSPVGDFGHGAPCWSQWAFGGVWHCMDLWEYYSFTLDETFLREVAYPLMRDAAEFCLDWFVPNPDGYLVVAPSSSPENTFIRPEDGGVGEVCAGSTQDTALAWDLVTNLIWSSEHLGIDKAFRETLITFREKLLPYRIGSKGQLLEWDKEYEEHEPNHRHLSHLIGFYPGRQITPDDEPELTEAVRKSLELRGDAGTGWSMAWKVCMWARLRDGNRAADLIAQQLKLARPVKIEDACETLDAGGTYPNLFGCCPPLMIDGNFGVTSGITEMLLQSHRQVNGAYEIHLLPALPEAWPEGSITGLCARGGFEIDLSWANGRLTDVSIQSIHGSPVRIRYEDTILEQKTKKAELIKPTFGS
ncbi:glycoside hydrolase family 95 protein [Rubellicoccus peritrichatus]|uniref:Glycoside hydrolase family 95 protein n=1 Tax=Rubellicoccus peritrichatus TaxID=3080537 RepID=A0AAQ3LCQ7_9BACT|nr:glycoside hydrolase family 95 protein [Puniceicoccus sp. CR14]WOO43295.1 glycoside hydrolase family 95 protein [Puniceicoccus sp. CR14]